MLELLKINCARCSKVFFTYEEDRQYCKPSCKGRHEYEKMHSNQQIYQLKPKTTCRNCHQEIAGCKAYCGYLCRKADEQKAKDANSLFSPIPKKRGRPKPYHVLNEMEEKKRLRSLR